MIKKSQNGQSLLVFVIVTTLIGGTLFSGFMIYWQTHLNVLARTRVAYDLMNVVEQAAKDVRVNWDNAAASLSPAEQAPCGTATPDIEQCSNNIKNAMTAFTPNPSCAGSCAPTNNLILCYANPEIPNNPYCFYGSTATSTARFELELRQPHEKKLNLFERSADQIAFLFYSGKDIEIFENKAFAGPSPSPSPSPSPTPTQTPFQSNSIRTDITGTLPNCVGATPAAGCMVCGAGSGRVCVSIYACPASFPTCAGFDGTSQKAIFAQQFTLIPPNDPN